ncbi:hypothetical protein [Methylomonas sp. 2B]
MPTNRQTPPPARPGWYYPDYFVAQRAKIRDQQQSATGADSKA